MKEENNTGCEEALNRLMDILEKGGNGDHLRKLIAENPDCAMVLRNQYRTWEELKEITTPEPSSDLHARFYRSLNELQIREEKSNYWKQLGKNLNRWFISLTPQWRWTFIAGIFVLGIASGLMISAPKNGKLENLVQFEKDPAILFATDRSQPSASDRMKEIQNFTKA